MAIKRPFIGFVSTLFCWARSRKHHLRELPWVPGSQLVGVLACQGTLFRTGKCIPETEDRNPCFEESLFEGILFRFWEEVSVQQKGIIWISICSNNKIVSVTGVQPCPSAVRHSSVLPNINHKQHVQGPRAHRQLNPPRDISVQDLHRHWDEPGPSWVTTGVTTHSLSWNCTDLRYIYI